MNISPFQGVIFFRNFKYQTAVPEKVPIFIDFRVDNNRYPRSYLALCFFTNRMHFSREAVDLRALHILETHLNL